MSGHPIVLKFGSSVLLRRAELPRVATEIYRYTRKGHPVLAVVSAFDGHTDKLIAIAEKNAVIKDSAEYASIVGLGEEQSAEALKACLDNIGLASSVLHARDMNLVAQGEADHAVPVSVDTGILMDALGTDAVTIVPGFNAVNANGEPVLLGRGGSDMSAIFLAYALGLPSARLIKDVDGLYNSDPNRDPGALRYDQLDWADARRIGGILVQSEAVAFAALHAVEIEVAKIGQIGATTIGSKVKPPQPAPKLRSLRVALAGCGTVGGGVAKRLLAEPSRYELTGVLVKSPEKHGDRQYVNRLVNHHDELLEAVPDVLIEATNGTDARHLITRALDSQIHVISANKQAIASDLGALLLHARTSGMMLRYSACVGGAAPIIETIDTIGDEHGIASIEGVLNGTVNYIGSKLAEGLSAAQAFAAAREAGFAEADPSSDLSGADAMAKARILAAHIFKETEPTEQGLELPVGDAAQELLQTPNVPKQVVRISRETSLTKISVTLENEQVHPFLAALEGEYCGAVITLKNGEVIRISARGAGRIPTTESLLGDLGEIERHLTAAGTLAC